MQTVDRSEAAAREPISLGGRVFGILTSPRETFERVMVDPRWVAILALGVGSMAVLGSLLLTTDFAQRAMLDEQVSTMESFGVAVTDEVRAEMEQSGESAAYTTFGFLLVGVPVVCVILAGMLHGVGYGLLGAGASFGQVFSVVAHAGVVFPVQQILAVPLNYAREAITSPTTLAAFAPMLDEDAFAYKLLSTIDLVNVWWIMILSIGLAVAWKRRTAPIATTLFGIYAGIALIIAVLRTNLGF